MTILEAIQRSTEYLVKKGVESARLHSELLLGHVLNTPRLKLYLEFERTLTDEETAALRELVQRRGTREPLQHILGFASFCGLEMQVNSSVLVPRPETELLAEQGWRWLEASGVESTFLDFGTGSGCIAIALCHFATEARGWALDRSPEALAVGRDNAAKHGMMERLNFVESDGFLFLDAEVRFDLVISNPPYIPSDEIDKLQEEVRKHDPRMALDGGIDGLDFYHRLAKEAPARLTPKGKLMVEFGDGQETALNDLFSSGGWAVETILNDYTGRPRILIARRSE